MTSAAPEGGSNVCEIPPRRRPGLKIGYRGTETGSCGVAVAWELLGSARHASQGRKKSRVLHFGRFRARRSIHRKITEGVRTQRNS